MDTGIKEVAYLWRELDDKWYRIQTNSPYLIAKLKRRQNATICGKTTIGSKQYWLIFRIKYNKPSTAKQSFKRLTNCRNNFTYRNGVFRAEVSTNGSLQSDFKYQNEVSK